MTSELTEVERLRAANAKLGREMNEQAASHSKRWKRLTRNYQDERDANHALRVALRKIFDEAIGIAPCNVLAGAIAGKALAPTGRRGRITRSVERHLLSRAREALSTLEERACAGIRQHRAEVENSHVEMSDATIPCDHVRAALTLLDGMLTREESGHG